MHPQAADMMTLFKGWNKNYGAYKLTGEVDERGKVLGKPYSLAGTVSMELWSQHLSGKQGLGIIPITDESVVKFAAIDIDEYGLDLRVIAKNIKDAGFPLVLCRTKSGGAHLYLFLTEWLSAKLVQQKMREMAAHLGYGSCEIFPKQVTILAERGDVGQWINMPYYNESETDRYCIDEDGRTLGLKDFIKYAFSKLRSPDEFAAIQVRGSEKEVLKEGPPCLNHLAQAGFPAGTRNNGLFNLGLYAQKVDPDNWQSLLQEYNTKFMDPPLSPAEVQGVVKSLNKAKGYNYTCKQAPIVNFCNMAKCRLKRYGIGVMGVGMPKLGTLCKICTKPPIWFVDVEGAGRVELETDDLQYLKNYQTRCMEDLNIMPPGCKSDQWTELVAKLLEDVTTVEVPMEATPQGLLRQYLEEFCLGRAAARDRSELLIGKVWTDRGFHFFRMRDFMAFLDRMRFKEFKMNRVAVYLREWGAEKTFLNVPTGGGGVNVYMIKEFTTQHFVKPAETTEKQKEEF